MDMSKYESSVNLELSSDKLVAFVSLKTIYDDEKYVPEDLESYIRKQGIVHGLLHDHIRSICKEPIQYMNRKIEVAKGEPAGKGIDGSVVFVDVEDKHRESDNSDNDVIDFKTSD